MLPLKSPATGRYIDPLVDFAFKRIFGSESNKDLLIAFLNEVFKGRKIITGLTYSKNEHPGEGKTEGGAIFDLLCTGSQGEHFIIEIQRNNQQYFKERALFYTSRLISGQAPKGNRSGWAYNLQEVYLVALLEDFTLANVPENRWLHDIYLCNRQTGTVFYEKLGFTYIELRKFVKTESELETELDKWLYVLKHLSSMNNPPDILKKPVFEKLFRIAEYSNLSKQEKMNYDSSLKYKWDNENVLDYAVKQAEERATHKRNTEIGREMKKEGMPVAQIAKFTGLSIEEIEKL